MKNIENISFEDLFREYEKNPKLKESKKFKKRMQELAGLKKNKISPEIVEAINKFKELVNQATDEIKKRRK